MSGLSSLDPATVGREAVTRVLARLGRLALPLSPGVALSWDGGLGPGGGRLRADHGASDLAVAVTLLTRWCQTGDLADWGDAEGAADALHGAAEALCAAPLRPWEVSDLDAAVDLERDAEPSAVALVLACALSRLRVCRGDAVTLGELARLASVTAGRVRQLVAAGEIAARSGSGPQGSTVEALEARRWLASRGLPGWGG